MHTVLRLAVLLSAVCTVLPQSPRWILDGEFGAARSRPKEAKVLPAAPPAPSLSAPPQTATAGAAEAKPAATGKRYPYHGTVHSTDSKRGIITLAGKKKNRVILITSDTNITRDGKRARLAGAIPGEKVTGSVRKNEAGQEQAMTLRLKGK